jgi:hypothetical protein
VGDVPDGAIGDTGLWDDAMRRPTAESAARAWRMVQERG